MLCYTCYIPAAKQRKWASYGPPISYFLRKIQQFWICVISTLHFILCRKSVEITAFFAASTSAYYRQLPICSLRLQRLKIPRPSKACRFEPGYQHQAAASNVLFAAVFLSSGSPTAGSNSMIASADATLLSTSREPLI